MAVQRGLLGRVEGISEPLHKGWGSGMWRRAERSGLDLAARGEGKGNGMMLLEQEPEQPLFPRLWQEHFQEVAESVTATSEPCKAFSVQGLCLWFYDPAAVRGLS